MPDASRGAVEAALAALATELQSQAPQPAAATATSSSDRGNAPAASSSSSTGMLEASCDATQASREAAFASGSDSMPASHGDKQKAAKKLQEKGFDLRQLLHFCQKYQGAGRITSTTTTAEVVRDIIIPETADAGVHYMASEFMTSLGGGKLAKRLGSHAWKAPFMNTLLNILLDATEWQRRDLTSGEFPTSEKEPWGNLPLLDVNGKLRAADLLQGLDKAILDKTYWLCVFAVNEHAAICGTCWTCSQDEKWTKDPKTHLQADPCLVCHKEKHNPCKCGMKKTEPGDESHEIDLFDFVVGFVDALVVCLDPKLEAIRRVWCVAEVGRALKAGTVYFRLAQGLAADLVEKLWQGEDLLETVEKCQATSDADRERILKNIQELPGGVAAYDAFVNRLLVLSLGNARKLHELNGKGLDAVRRMKALEMDVTWAKDLISTQELLPEDTFSILSQLESFKMDCGGLGELSDISALKGLETLLRLKELSLVLRTTKVADIAALSRLGKLTSLLKLNLDLCDTQVVDIAAFSCLGKLTSLLELTLDLSVTQVADITALSCLGNLTSLTELILKLGYKTKVADIAALSCLGKLTSLLKLSLDLSSTQVEDISALSCLGKLTSLLKLGLGHYNTRVADITALSCLGNLTLLTELILDLSYSKVSLEDKQALWCQITTALPNLTIDMQ
eukprot:TRINITY_DN10279_c0_g1_i4.p1 TRINITY_DN10279_c0_g1~~TRINITY_DN10279_c0_g1_i4.p1  ORF type:complete len:709 (+),score=164.47 TRINITY_DN10279_c0_g1_i4:91-2127(+)